MNARKMLAGAFIMMLGMGMTSFKEDDRNFQISKNLDIFNSIFKELDMFYVDTVNAEKMIQTGVEGMLSLTDPYTEYYPEEEVSSLKEMTTGKYGGIGAHEALKAKQARHGHCPTFHCVSSRPNSSDFSSLFLCSIITDSRTDCNGQYSPLPGAEKIEKT